MEAWNLRVHVPRRRQEDSSRKSQAAADKTGAVGAETNQCVQAHDEQGMLQTCRQKCLPVLARSRMATLLVTLWPGACAQGIAEVAQVLHRANLLCLLANGLLVDEAANDHLVQARRMPSVPVSSHAISPTTSLVWR